jgi:hypothetical protein
MSRKGSIKIPTAKHLAYLIQNITRKVSMVTARAPRGRPCALVGPNFKHLLIKY